MGRWVMRLSQILSWVFGASLSVFVAGNAQAGVVSTVDPSTFYNVGTGTAFTRAAVITSSLGGTNSSYNTKGGACTLGTGGCGITTGSYPTVTSGVFYSTAVSTAGDYNLSATITGTNGAGQIYDLWVNGVDLGHTSVILDTASGSTGSFTTALTLSAGSQISFAVVDLTQEWDGSKPYTLPGLLGNSSDNDSNGLATNFVTTSIFRFNYSLSLSSTTTTTAPEPASVTLFSGGIAVIGLMRRRRAYGDKRDMTGA